MSELLKVEKKEGIAYLTLNRPEKLNAFAPDLVAALIANLKECDDDEDVKAVVITGAGRAFCSGGDVSTMGSRSDPGAILASMKKTSQLTKTITQMDKYVISAVHGFAAGAGFSVALASDFIVADQDAKFIASFTNIGLVPDLGLIKFLSDSLTPSLAKEWISSGKRVSATEAFERGIVSRVTTGNLLEETADFAQFIVNGPPIANKFVKYLVNNSGTYTQEQAIMQENIVQSLMFQTGDMKEGVQSFLEKRKPDFKGR